MGGMVDGMVTETGVDVRLLEITAAATMIAAPRINAASTTHTPAKIRPKVVALTANSMFLMALVVALEASAEASEEAIHFPRPILLTPSSSISSNFTPFGCVVFGPVTPITFSLSFLFFTSDLVKVLPL